MAKRFNKDAKATVDKKIEKTVEKAETESTKPEAPKVEKEATSAAKPSSSTTVPGATQTVIEPVAAAKSAQDAMSIKPVASNEQLSGKLVGGVPLADNLKTSVTPNAAAGARTNSYVGKDSRLPYTKGGLQRDSRFGKANLGKDYAINHTPSEQFTINVDDFDKSKSSHDVGANGTMDLDQARSHKSFVVRASGVNQPRVAQQNGYSASVDYHISSAVVYTNGQTIDSLVASRHDMNYPSVNAEGMDIANPMDKGNYLAKQLNITYEKGHITKLEVIEDRFFVEAEGDIADNANLNLQMDDRNNQLSIEYLQRDCSDENRDNWSPLGFAIYQPKEWQSIFRDVATTTGSIVSLAQRSALCGHEFTYNLLAKDGDDFKRNAIQLVVESLGYEIPVNEDVYFNELDFNDIVFNTSLYQQGACTAIIAFNDSTNKYKTLADLLNQRRSMKLWLLDCDKYNNQFFVKPEFEKAVDKAHLFSTFSGSYNPQQPIYATRFIRPVTPISWNWWLDGWTNPALNTGDKKKTAADGYDAETGTITKYVYAYDQIRYKHVTFLRNPLIEGICKWLLDNENHVRQTFLGKSETDGIIKLPINFDMMRPNLFSYLVCAALPDISTYYNRIYRDLLYIDKSFEALWPNLVHPNPYYSSQLTIGNIDSPLVLGKMAKDSMIRMLWPNQMLLAGGVDVKSDSDKNADTDKWVQYYLPWYFSERSFNTTGEFIDGYDFFKDNNALNKNMSIPSIRQNITHDYVNAIRETDPADILLSLDIWATIPKFTTQTQENKSAKLKSMKNDSDDTGYTYRNEQVKDYSKKVTINAIRYDSLTDGRVAITYKPAVDANSHLHAAGLYCIPKQLGFIDEDYYPIHICNGISMKGSDVIIDGFDLDNEMVIANLATNSTMYNGGSSKHIRSYRVEENEYDDTDSIATTALKQVYYSFYAGYGDNEPLSYNSLFVNKTGVLPCLSFGESDIVDLNHLFVLNTENVPADAVLATVSTRSRSVNTMLSYIFLPINVFENCVNDYKVTSGRRHYDPMEQSFYFGVCGFFAGDYSEMFNDRIEHYLDQKRTPSTMIVDTYVSRSPIFK